MLWVGAALAAIIIFIAAKAAPTMYLFYSVLLFYCGIWYLGVIGGNWMQLTVYIVFMLRVGMPVFVFVECFVSDG